MGLTAARQPLKEGLWAHDILWQSMGFIVRGDVDRDVDLGPRKKCDRGTFLTAQSGPPLGIIVAVSWLSQVMHVNPLSHIS
jgi:hypothetical protein